MWTYSLAYWTYGCDIGNRFQFGPSHVLAIWTAPIEGRVNRHAMPQANV